MLSRLCKNKNSIYPCEYQKHNLLLLVNKEDSSKLMILENWMVCISCFIQWLELIEGTKSCNRILKYKRLDYWLIFYSKTRVIAKTVKILWKFLKITLFVGRHSFNYYIEYYLYLHGYSTMLLNITESRSNKKLIKLWTNHWACSNSDNNLIKDNPKWWAPKDDFHV